MSDYAARPVVLQPLMGEVALAWFLRIVAVYCLLFGVLYWIRLIGLYPGPLWRFDLMPVHWQVAASMLAVLFPFASAGLWMLASWGPVIWVLCAATECIMYAGLPQLFGHHWPVVFIHCGVAAGYVVLRAMIYWQKKQFAQ